MNRSQIKSAPVTRPENYLTFEEFAKVPGWALEHTIGWEPEKVRFALLDGTLSVNLNTLVRFQLTNHGREQLKSDKYQTVTENADGSFECPLWEFMRVFGRHFHMGCQVPTEQNAIVLQPDRSLLTRCDHQPRLKHAKVMNRKSGRKAGAS